MDEIKEILTHLRETYNPPVRGTRIVGHRRTYPPPTENTSGPRVYLQPPTAAGCSRSFSRKPACDWLTALISHLQKCISNGGEGLETHEGLLDTAAALLAVLAGTASAGKLNRTFSFDQPQSAPIQVEVTDIPLENQDYTTLGAQTWGGAHVLAEIIIQNPRSFGFHPDQLRSTAGPNILELGAGTGLVSLAVYRYLASRGLDATIYATDFNPLILDNLARNISINRLAISEANTHIKISCDLLDWSNPDAANIDLFGSVDLVLGADVIYEELHARWIRSCLEKFMRKPMSESVRPMFHLVIPLRPTHAFESNTIEGIFPLRSENGGQNGWGLVVFSRDSILCDAGDDGTDGQVEYAYYTIGWENKTPKPEYNNNPG